MTPGVALRLGRVSNLPTVWTNVLAGIVLAGGTVAEAGTLVTLVALSLFYLGGMYLNDAFDAEIDAAERPERPIPSGAVTRRTVFTTGFVLLAAGLALLAWRGYGFAGGTGVWPFAGGVALGVWIVFYDWYHKDNPLSPVVMGLCRMLVYVAAGLSIVVPLPDPVLIGAGLLLCYLIGLTYIAKQETLGRVANLWPLLFLAAPVGYGLWLATERPEVGLVWVLFVAWMGRALWFVRRRGPGDIPRAVVGLLAGICLLDALLIAGTGAVAWAGAALAAFALTVALQRVVPAT